MESKVTIIMQEMLPLLNNEQLLALRESLEHHLVDGKKQQKYSNNNLLQLFITAKQVEGCSSKTIRYYQRTIENLFNAIKESVTQLTTDDLRSYLANYQSEKDCSKANLDNIRRILSSFFAWLEQEEYIIKNPIRRIKKIKTEQNVKETYTDEHLEIMRDNCENLRDLAIIDLLASTGMRVGELVQLNRSDIDFENRECVVFGKGKKERPVYFDARTKIHLRNYLNDRKDSHPALFVTLVGKAQRLGIAGVEIRLRKLGDKLGIQKVHTKNSSLKSKSRFNEMFGDPLNNNKKFAVKTGQQCFKFSSGKFLDKHDRVFEGYPAYGGNGIAWKSRKYLIDNPTIIIGRVGAYCGNVRTTHGKVWISDNAIYIKEFKNSDFNLVFLLELMKVIDFSKFADFSGQPKITQKPLENQKYILPPLALQNEFADFVALVDKSQFACEIAIKVWRNSLKFSII
ncbi:integrase/recombinase, phage integrase family protein [Streptococcus pneumoniae]|nr:integrase/recombinase, phage integrase family protein [Streptococcus pneumoniae]